MNRRIASFSGAAGIAILLGMGVVWNEYLHTPPVELHQLPSNLIALNSPAGQALLAESDAIADYDELRANFVAQSRKSYCGVASAVMVLNAANATGAPLDQRTIFANPSIGLHPLKVSFRGMSLLELGDLLRAHGAKVTVVRASSTDVDAFRREIRENLSREGDYLLINYGREYLGQTQSGHISPIAAYHVQSDRLLVLDVAANKYPPAWVRLQEVWEAMSAPLNAKTSITRGFIVIHATRANPSLARLVLKSRPDVPARSARGRSCLKLCRGNQARHVEQTPRLALAAGLTHRVPGRREWP